MFTNCGGGGSVKILVVDDHPMVRKGLIATLKFDEKIDEILEASSKDEGIMYILTYKPDIAFYRP